MNYILHCYNDKDRLIYTIEGWFVEEDFDKQIKEGYLRCRDSNGLDTVYYINMYKKIVITKYI